MRLAYMPRMENLDPAYDETVEEEKRRIYLYLGDDFGILKIWDLTYLLAQAEIQPCPHFAEVRGDQYFPGRSERVDVGGYASRLRKIARANNEVRR